MKLILKILFLFFIWAASFGSLQAYPNFISLGYDSCLACHFNPYGNGQLSDYGRVVGATGVADRLFSKKKTSEENLADAADFFFGKVKKYKKQQIVRAQLNYRNLYLMRDTFGGKNPENDFITMDLSGSLALQLMDRKLVAVGQIAYSPLPEALKGTDEVEYRSREHYIGYRPVKTFGIYAGLMDKVFGLRVPDHIAVNRTFTGTTQNDQTHGILFHYAQKKVDIGVQGFVGNLAQDEELRQSGATAQAEYTLLESGNVVEKLRVGVSALGSQSDFVDNTMYATHLRAGLGKGHSVMAEFGQVHMTPTATETTTRTYFFNQNHFMFRRGLFGLFSWEYGKPNPDMTMQRFGLGTQFFPMNRVEARLDVYGTKNTTKTATSESDSLTYQAAAQLHLWL